MRRRRSNRRPGRGAWPGGRRRFARPKDQRLLHRDPVGQGIEQRPRHRLHNRGPAYSDKGQHDRAIQDYDQAIKLNRSYAGAYSDRGIAYSAKGQHDRAIQDYDQAIKLDPSDAIVFNNRGISYRAKGQHDRAIQDYDQAIKLNRSYAIATTIAARL